MKYLSDKEFLRKEGNVWLYDKKEIKVPERVYEIIKEKLTRLNEEEIEILESASVLGNEFTANVLEKMLGMDRVTVLRILSKIEKAYGLLRHEKNTYKFEPSRIREVVYNELGEELRTALHEIAGKIFEEEYQKGDADKMLVMVYHYLKAGRIDKLKEYGFAAGEKLAERFAYTEAIEILQRLYDVLDKCNVQEKKIALDVLEKIVEILISSGLFVEAADKIEEKINLAGENALEKGRGYLALAEVLLKMGEHAAALERINVAFEEFEKLPEDEKNLEMGKALATEGYIHERCGRYAEAIEAQKKAIGVFEKYNMDVEIARAYNRIGAILYYEGRYSESMDYLRKSEEIFMRKKDYYGLSLVYNNLGMVYYELEDFENAREILEKSIELKKRIHDLDGMAISKNNLGNVYFENNEFEKALAEYLEAKHLCNKTGNKWMFVYNQIDIAELYAEKGDKEKYMEAIEEARKVAAKIGIESEVEEAMAEIVKKFGGSLSAECR